MNIEYAKAILDWLQKNRDWDEFMFDTEDNAADLAAALAAVPKPVEAGSVEVRLAVAYIHCESTGEFRCVTSMIRNGDDETEIVRNVALHNHKWELVTEPCIVRVALPPVKATPVVEGTTLTAAKEVL